MKPKKYTTTHPIAAVEAKYTGVSVCHVKHSGAKTQTSEIKARNQDMIYAYRPDIRKNLYQKFQRGEIPW